MHVDRRSVLRALWSVGALKVLPSWAASAAGLPVTDPARVGLDGGTLEQLATDIARGRYSNLHGLLIVRHGKLAFERYFTGDDQVRGTPIGRVRFDNGVLHDCRSVTKTVVSLLCGIAIDEGLIPSAEVSVARLLPDRASHMAPWASKVRLHDLLSMTSGIQWDEESTFYGDPKNSETAMDAAPDRIDYVLGQPLKDEPSRVFNYNGGNTVLVAAAIERAAKRSLDDYARRTLFRGLGIERFEWLKYPSGTAIAASGLRLLPRDMAKLGQLCLDRGRWNGARVVSARWIEQSLGLQSEI